MIKTSRKTSRKPHAETTKDPRFKGMADCVGIPNSSPYPKPFNLTLRVQLAFLMLACLQEQALDAARIKKASHFRERLCSETGI
jgi:hypothetical protein